MHSVAFGLNCISMHCFILFWFLKGVDVVSLCQVPPLGAHQHLEWTFDLALTLSINNCFGSILLKTQHPTAVGLLWKLKSREQTVSSCVSLGCCICVCVSIRRVCNCVYIYVCICCVFHFICICVCIRRVIACKSWPAVTFPDLANGYDRALITKYLKLSVPVMTTSSDQTMIIIARYLKSSAAFQCESSALCWNWHSGCHYHHHRLKFSKALQQ